MTPTPLTERQKYILRRLQELNEPQKFPLRAMSPDEATASPLSLAELEAYEERAQEISVLIHELIASVKAEGPV